MQMIDLGLFFSDILRVVAMATNFVEKWQISLSVNDARTDEREQHLEKFIALS